MTNIVLDASALNNLMLCPRLYDFKQNHALVPREGKSNSLQAGSLVHIIHEFFNKAIMNGKSRNDSMDIGFIAGREYVRGSYQPNNTYLGIDSEYAIDLPEESDKYDIGWKFIFKTMEEYFDYWKNDSATIVGVEEVKKKIIYEDSEMRILWKAKLDRIVDMPHGIMSVDVKTMKQRRDTNSNNIQFMGQCIVTESRNMIIDKIGFQTSLKPHEKFERAVMNYTLDRLNEFKDEIVSYYGNMLTAYTESGNFPPNFTQCQNKYGDCEFYRYDVCNSDRGMRGETLKLYFKEGKKWDPV